MISNLGQVVLVVLVIGNSASNPSGVNNILKVVDARRLARELG